MPKSDFSVAISTYDAFNHLRVGHDIIRYNWPGREQTPICLSSNNPMAESGTQDIKIDKYIAADESIPWTRDGGKTTDKIGFRARALDCIQHAGMGALELGCDYTIHTHADGWILSGQKVQEIVNYMKEHDKVLAAGGLGMNYHVRRYNIDHVGELDDYFFVIDNNFARDTDFWNFKAKYGHLKKGHVWYLVTRFLEVSSIDKLYHYQDYTSDDIEYGGKIPREVRPYRYDDTYKMLHIDDFNKYHNVVVDIFKRNGISAGPYVEQLLVRKLDWQSRPPVELRLNWREKVWDKLRQVRDQVGI